MCPKQQQQLKRTSPKHWVSQSPGGSVGGHQCVCVVSVRFAGEEGRAEWRVVGQQGWEETLSPPRDALPQQQRHHHQPF